MKNYLLESSELEKYFSENDYDILKPVNVVNNKDTVFITAGIQPILSSYLDSNFDSKRVYLAQPVLRTQYIDCISEGNSIAFVNLTTSGVNVSRQEHDSLVNDWLNLFRMIGTDKKDITSKTKEYQRDWGNIFVSGEKTFYYYKNVEIGDTTFFNEVRKNREKVCVDSMSDLGFGLERIRWILNNKSYFDLYSDSAEISPLIKGYLLALGLLLVNDVTPSNKNSGYRMRLLSKKLVDIICANELNESEQNYLIECLKYWKEWQKVNHEVNLEIFRKEYVRNCNRYILNLLEKEGYKNLSSININVSKDILEKKLYAFNIPKEKIKKLIK